MNSIQIAVLLIIGFIEGVIVRDWFVARNTLKVLGKGKKLITHRG